MALRQRSLHLIGLSKSQSPKRKAASDANVSLRGKRQSPGRHGKPGQRMIDGSATCTTLTQDKNFVRQPPHWVDL